MPSEGEWLNTREKFKEVVLRLENVEKGRFCLLQGLVDNRFKAINARIDSVHDRIYALRKDMDNIFDPFQKDINSRLDAFRGEFSSFWKEVDNRLEAFRGEFISFQKEVDSRFEALREDFVAFQRGGLRQGLT